MNGMLPNADGTERPGAILELWRQLRTKVGVVEAKKKDGVKFKVRSAEDLIDKMRAVCNDLGILVYPAPSADFQRSSTGKGHVVEDGTLAEQELVVIAQAVEDGSRLAFWGFGLGADNQDKAGGKAGTYAFKQALIQALLAGGKDNAKALGVADTDDTDAPIDGGVRKKSRPKLPTVEEVRAALDAATTEPERKAAIALVMQLSPDKQVSLKDALLAAKQRIAALGEGGSAPT